MLIEDINALEICHLQDGDINRKILMLLPKPKYSIITSMLQKENLDRMEVCELIGEIWAHEMSVLGILDETSSRTSTGKNIAFKAKTKRSAPKAIKPQIIESSSESEDEVDDQVSSENEEEELALLMKKFNRLNSKINKKGYNFDPKRKAFRPRRDDNKKCYNCGDEGHISYDCPKPDKRKSSNKGKYKKEKSEDEDDKPKKRHSFNKISNDKRSKLFPKKKKPQRSFMCDTNEWVTDEESSEESSDDEEFAALAISSRDLIFPHHLCASWQRGALR